MLSGLGPAEELKQLNIPVVHNLVGVGSHLMDHPVVDLNFRDKTKKAPIFLRPGFSIVEITLYLMSLLQYFIFRSGAMTSNVR